jgi:ParB family chromosome partitioning protein
MSAAKTRLPSLSALAAIGGAALQGSTEAGPTLLPIDKITEDASQPRNHFDAAQLDELAASIRARGVLQPIGVVKTGGDTYRIVFGARRHRAARIAALQVIPAVVLPEHQATLDVQMIENIHRSDLRNSELVAGIIRMGKDGKSRKEIAELLGWDPERVKRCQALDGAPPVILQVLDGGTAIRAAYDLFYAWKKAPQAIEAALGDRTELSYAEVRALIATVQDKAPRQPEPIPAPVILPRPLPPWNRKP